MPDISIVIRAFNEEKHLPALFDGLASQTLTDFETIVVDSGSFDRTREIAEARATRLVRIPQQDFTFGHSLNVGILAGAGRYLAIISAHTLPSSPQWLERLIEPLRQDRVAMVYGRQEGWKTSKFSEIMDFERTFGPDRKVLDPPHFFANNANSAVKRDLWEKHRFDETLPGLEDIEWAKFWMEKGMKVVYEPAASLYHIHDESWPQVRRRYYREGQAAKWIGIRRRRDLPREASRELGCLAADCLRALQTGRWLSLPEITRFRYEKNRGYFGGVLDGALMENPLRRQEMLFDRGYQAVAILGPGRHALEDRLLRRPNPGEVLIRVAYQGVCATDLEILDGHLGYYKSGLAQYPIVPGHELSGTVVAAGAKVSNVKEGDRVVVECIQGCGECPDCASRNPIACAARKEVGVIGRDGGYAEYILTPGHFVHPLPGPLTLQQACLAEPLAVVLKALRRLQKVWGVALGPRRCAVIGAGAIGHLAARILASRGQKVTIFDSNPARLRCFTGSTIAAEQALEDLASYEVLVEASGNPDALDKVLRDSRAGSNILLLGLPYGQRTFNFESIVGYDKTIIGSVGSSAEDFDEALVTLPALDTRAFFEKLLPLKDYEQAWELSRRREHLKVILQADPSAL